ncbi:hypothetical protein THAOC_04930, partial [Thalassiosira oceanica]
LTRAPRPILISPDVPTRAEPAAPIDRQWSLDVSPALSRSDPQRGGAGTCGAVMGVPRAAEARRGVGGPCSSTDEPIQTEPVSPLDRGGSRDGSPAISWPGMDHGSGARRAPTAADEAPDPIYGANDDPTMTAVRWTNDVSSDDTDGATGPPTPPMGTSTMAEVRGRRSRLAVDVGSISASRRRREADESSNTTPARFCRRTTFWPTMTRTDDSGPLNSITDTSRGSQAGIRRAAGGVIEWIEPTTASSSTRFDGSKRRAAKIGIDRRAEGSRRVEGA